LDACISIHFVSKTEEEEDVKKYACRLFSKSGTQADELI